MNSRSKRRTSITGTPPILSRGSIRTLRCAQVGQLTHSFHTTDHPSQTERSPLVRQPCRNLTDRRGNSRKPKMPGLVVQKVPPLFRFDLLPQRLDPALKYLSVTKQRQRI